ncbi:MAG: hypothetical protein JNJ83_21370 [Verrucomicrobiaceae bacterium]|nr:hypothetical protein [Verrucomicrobiaceae bacterium]
MKNILVLFLASALNSIPVFAQNQIAIFKRAETVAGTYQAEQLNPAQGLAPAKTTVKLEAFEIIDLTAKQRIVVTKDMVGKKYTVGAIQNTIGYSVLPLRTAGTSLWYRGSGQSAQAEADYGSGTVPGFDYFPDATATSPAGDGIPDYFSTWHYVQAEAGKAGPVKIGTLILNVPTTISIAGDVAEQYEDQGFGERGVAGSTIKGTVTFDKGLTTKVNTGTPQVGFSLGTMTYGLKLVRDALAATGFTELVP